MFVAARPVRSKRPVAFERCVACSVIDPNHSNADRIRVLLEFLDLAFEVADHAINLFDHRLREDLGLRPDFYGTEGASCDEKARIGKCEGDRDPFAKRAVPSPTLDANRRVGRAYD